MRVIGWSILFRPGWAVQPLGPIPVYRTPSIRWNQMKIVRNLNQRIPLQMTLGSTAFAIDEADLTDFTVMIGTVDGPQFSYSKGDVIDTDTLLLARSAASMTLLAAVEDGVLALDDHPQDYLSRTSDPLIYEARSP